MADTYISSIAVFAQGRQIKHGETLSPQILADGSRVCSGRVDYVLTVTFPVTVPGAFYEANFCWASQEPTPIYPACTCPKRCLFGGLVFGGRRGDGGPLSATGGVSFNALWGGELPYSQLGTIVVLASQAGIEQRKTAIEQVHHTLFHWAGCVAVPLPPPPAPPPVPPLQPITVNVTVLPAPAGPISVVLPDVFVGARATGEIDGALQEGLQGIEDAIEDVAGDVTLGLQAWSMSLLPDIPEALLGLIQNVGNLFGDIFNSLATLPDIWQALWDSLYNQFQESEPPPEEPPAEPGEPQQSPLAGAVASGTFHSDQLLDALKAEQGQGNPFPFALVILGLLFAFREGIAKLIGDTFASGQQLFEPLGFNPSSPPNLEQIDSALRGMPEPFQTLFRVWFAASLLPQVVGASQVGTLELYQQRSLRQTLPRFPSLELLTVAEQRLGTAEVGLGEAATAQGFKPSHLAAFRAVAEQQLAPGQIMERWLRSLGGGPDLDVALGKLGYGRSSIETFKQLAFLQPTPQDLILFLVREVFTPEIRAKFGLDQEFPVAGIEPAHRIGINKDLLGQYWAAHWQLPSPTQGFDMLHRTVDVSEDPDADSIELLDGSTIRNVIGSKTLAALLRTADYVPFWRPKLQAISYNPLTRVDVRRMHKVGVLSKVEVQRAYLDLGYDLLNATRLADFVERINASEANAELEPFRTGLKGRVVSAYIDGTLGHQDLRDALLGLGYELENVAAFVAEAEFIRESERMEAVRVGVKKFYTTGLWDRDQTAVRLVQEGFDPNEADRLFRQWDILREFRDVSDAMFQTRDLTKGEILESYKEHILTADDAAVALQQLGYDVDETYALLRLADAQLARAETNTLREAIRTAFITGQISLGTARARLDALKLPVANRDALLARWQAERAANLPKLTLAQIEEAVRRHIITEEDSLRELHLHGYDERQITILLALWGARRQLSPPARR